MAFYITENFNQLTDIHSLDIYQDVNPVPVTSYLVTGGNILVGEILVSVVSTYTDWVDILGKVLSWISKLRNNMGLTIAVPTAHFARTEWTAAQVRCVFTVGGQNVTTARWASGTDNITFDPWAAISLTLGTFVRWFRLLDAFRDEIVRWKTQTGG